MTEFPQPELTEVNRPFWEGLQAGELRCQTCANGHTFMPARDFCPECLSSDVPFTRCSGKARLLSWVVYHTAFHDAFKDRLPYNVSLVELEEGPRMMTNVLCEPGALMPEMSLELAIEQEGELSVARFRPAATRDEAIR